MGGGLCVLGYVFWQRFDQVATLRQQGRSRSGSVIALVVGGVAAYRWLRVAEHRARRTRGSTAGRAALLRPLARVAVAGLWRDRAAWRCRGPLRFVGARFTPGELGLELTTLLAVAGGRRVRLLRLRRRVLHDAAPDCRRHAAR